MHKFTTLLTDVLVDFKATRRRSDKREYFARW